MTTSDHSTVFVRKYIDVGQEGIVPNLPSNSTRMYQVLKLIHAGEILAVCTGLH